MTNQKNDPEEVEKLWQAYALTPNRLTLQKLMKAYLPLVKKIAGGFVRKKPNTLDYDDLIQAGNMGLMDAIGKFNPNAGASFKTYASIRIRGSILDEINSMDWTPRSVRKNIKDVIKTIEKHYEDGTAGAPTAQNLSKNSELNPEELTEVLVQMNKTYMVQMEPELFELVSPTFTLEKNELAISISMAIDSSLTDEERSFVYLKFFQEQDNKQIMKELLVNTKELNAIKESAMIKLALVLKGEQLD
mgnify:CR=1 FL=1